MKKIFFCLVMLVFGLDVTRISAQVSAINGDDKDCSPVISLNFVYIGVDNPVEVTMAGVAPENLVVELVNDTNYTRGAATIVPNTGKPGQYVIHPTEYGRINIRVGVKAEDGTVRHLITQPIGMKRIPIPQIYLGSNAPGSSISKYEFGAMRIRLVLPEFDFLLSQPLFFEKLDFSVSSSARMPMVIQGDQFSPEQLDIIKTAPKNAKVYISGTVKTPDGVSHYIDASFKIK